MARTVYGTFVPAGMPYLQPAQSNWATTTVTSGQPRPQNLNIDSMAIEVKTNAAAALLNVDDAVVYLRVQGYAMPFDGGGANYKISATPTTIPTNNTAYIQTANGRVFINDDPVINVKSRGAKADFQESAAGGSITAASTTLTVTEASFVAGVDEGKWIQVNGAGTLIDWGLTSSGSLGWTDYHTTTIAEVLSSTTVRIAVAAVQTVSGARVFWATDDTIPLQQACRAAATLLRPAYAPAGKYLSTSAITGVNGYSNFHLCGDGNATVIYHGGQGQTIEGFQFQFVGGLVARSTLTVEAKMGDDVLTVASSANLVVNDYFVLRDQSQLIRAQDQEGAFGLFVCYVGEICRVRAIPDATHIRIEGCLENDYTIDSDIRELSSPPTDINIRDICLDHTKPICTTGSATISMARVIRPRFTNVLFRNSNNNSILGASFAIDGSAINCRFEDIGGPDGIAEDGTVDQFKGYCLNLSNGCHNWRVSNCTARNVRHFTTAGGGSDTPPRHIHISDCVATGSRIPFDTHPGGEFWSFINCHAIAGLNSEQVEFAGYGFQIRGNYTDVVGCSAAGMSIGIMVVQCTGNRVIDFKSDNNLIGACAWDAPDTEFRGIKIYQPRITGIQVIRSITGSHPLLSLGKIVLDDIRIVGNPTRTNTLIDYRADPGGGTIDIASGIQFGRFVANVFTSQWEDQFTLTNWHADDCTVQLLGVDHGAAYGFGLPTAALVVAESVPRARVESGALAALTTATLYMVRIDGIEKGMKIAGLGVLFAGTGTTQDNGWCALYDKNRVKLAVSADATTTEPVADVLTAYNFASTFTATYSGPHYAAIMIKGAAMPTVRGVTSHTSATGLAPITVGNSTAGQTVPGSAPATAAAITATAIIPYVAVLGIV